MLKKLSKRELIMLIILVLIVVYYFAVQLPVSRLGAGTEAQLAEVTAQLDENNLKVEQKNAMAIKLNQYRSNPTTPITPEYDNTNSIILDMNSIFGSTDAYSISFEEPVTEGKIVRRPVTVSFNASSYDDAVIKTQRIEGSKNCYLLGETTITSSVNDSDAPYAVVIEMTSFEYLNK